MFLCFLLFYNFFFFPKTILWASEVIYVFCTLFENINFADYLQFASVHPRVSYSFNLDNAEQLHVELTVSMKAKVILVLILLKNLT